MADGPMADSQTGAKQKIKSGNAETLKWEREFLATGTAWSLQYRMLLSAKIHSIPRDPSSLRARVL
jgi:hypothetical protein